MNLADIIDIEILQHIQDGFSDAFELPAIIYDNEGKPITTPSRFTKFCTLVRSTEKGNANCQKFDALLMKELTHTKEPTVRHGCALKNIITATVPIIINDVHFANFGIGQVVEDDFDFTEIKEYAREIGVGEEELLTEAKTLIPVNKSMLNNSVKFLHVVATQISVLGYKNLQNRQLLEKVEKLNRTLEDRVKTALNEIKMLKGILPLCTYCKKIRGEDNQWENVDSYIHKHSEADISHSICPECAHKHFPEEYGEVLRSKRNKK